MWFTVLSTSAALLLSVPCVSPQRAEGPLSLEALWDLHLQAYPDGEAFDLRYRFTRWNVEPKDSTIQEGHCRLIHDAEDSVLGMRFWLEFSDDGLAGGLAGHDGQTIYRRFPGGRTIDRYPGAERHEDEFRQNNCGLVLAQEYYRPRSLEQNRAIGFHVERLPSRDLPQALAIRFWLFDTVQDLTYEQIRWIDADNGRLRRMERHTRILGVAQGAILVVRHVASIPEPDWSVLAARVDDGVAERPEDQATAGEPKPAGPGVGDPAPALAWTRPDGVGESLEDLRGQWVLLDFWHLACHPCLKAMPALEALAERQADRGLRLVALNAFNRPGAIADFMQHRGHEIPWATAPREVLVPWGVHGFPTLFLIDPEGQVVARELGLDSPLKERLDALLH